jgi:hypothetical protein
MLGPLDEHDRAVEVRLEIAPPLARQPIQPIEVEMRNGHPSLVAVADREGGACDRRLDSERPARAAYERRLPRAELARDADDVARREQRREASPDRLGLGRRAALNDLLQNRPS